MPKDLRDITIIGGGPTGLFASFYAGMRGKSCRIIDSLPELGGQLTALYPEKDIYDVGGYPKILAKDLAKAMVKQGLQFDPDVILDEEIVEIQPNGEEVHLKGRDDDYRTRALVICGGKGAFEPKKLRVPGFEDLLGSGVDYKVADPANFEGKRVLVVGGGDSALDWALILKDWASHLTLIHRRDGWRAHEKTVENLHEAAESDEIELKVFYEVKEIRGDGEVEEVVIFDNRSQEEEVREVDAVLTFLGFKPDLGPIKEWGLELERNRILVSQLMETNLPGVYGAGDVVGYDGKLDLIATGYAEAAIAVNNAIHHIDPDARVNPGHSTHLKVFKGEEEK